MRTAVLAEGELVEPLRERGLEAGWLDVLAALGGPARPTSSTRRS